MSELIVKEKEIVVPGEELAKGMDYLPGDGTYRDNDIIRSNKLGLAIVEGRAIKIVPVSGVYLPKKGDTIIGTVADITYSGWIFDIGCAYRAMLSLKDATSDFIARGADLTKYYSFGDLVVAKIYNVTSQNLIDLTLKGPGLKKLTGGRIVKVIPNKVPRIIGKSGSMISLIKEATNCQIVVGQNGLIWISGEPENEIIAVDTIKKIESESHKSGLTDEIQKYLKSKGE
ncbi:MAG: exosome complex RNA-binding protein Rrp4 [Candidatus Woesearchaeota archaeon]